MPGYGRTYFLYSCGYEKGYELHSMQSSTVEPLPFKAMGAYPDQKSYELWRDKTYWGVFSGVEHASQLHKAINNP